MRTRLDLDKVLREIIGNGNVYFQPNENVKMRYPCIRYSLYDIYNGSGDNRPFKQHSAYQLILIDPDPDSRFIQRIAELPMCSMDRFYTADNLNHYTFIIYL